MEEGTDEDHDAHIGPSSEAEEEVSEVMESGNAEDSSSETNNE